MSFEKGLKDFARDSESKIDRSIQELLYGYYPDLTDKEFAICKTITSAIWDICFPRKPFYKPVVVVTAELHKDLFHNTDEVETVVKQLVGKGIVRDNVTFLKWRPGKMKRCESSNCEGYLMWPARLLDLKREIEDEAFKIYSEFEDISIFFLYQWQPEGPL
jgi:hypothetical protein